MTNPDPIQQRIEIDADTKGAVDAQRALEGVEQATKEAGQATEQSADQNKNAERVQRDATDETKRAGDAADEAGKKQGLLGRTIENTRSAILGLVAGIAGVGGVITVYRNWIGQIDAANQRMKEQIAIVRELAEARLNFVALQGVEDPQQLSQIESAAAIAGRDPGEVFRVAGVIQSQFPNETPENRQALLQQTAAAAQLTDASLPDIAQGLSVLFRETGDAQTAGNLLQEAIQQAGEADPGRLAQEIGKFIGVGKQIGGLDAGEAAGFASAATGLGLPNEVATTGLKNVLFAIRGKGNPEGNEVLDRLGVDRSNVVNALQQIAAARSEGQISDAELESIGGREAAPVLAALADPQKLEPFLTSVRAVDAAEDFQGSIAGDKAAGIFTPGSIQAFNLIAKQAESQAKSVRSRDKIAAEAGAARAIIERELAYQLSEDNISPADAEYILKEYDAQIALGRSALEAANIAEQVRVSDVPLFRSPINNRNINLNVRSGAGTSVADVRAESDFLEGPIRQFFDAGPLNPGGGEAQPTTVIENQTIINEGGTKFIGARDPLDDDLDGRDRE